MIESIKRTMRTVSREIEQRLKLGKNAKPYHLWASVTKRPAAPPVATRQCRRNLLFRAAFDTFTRTYAGEGRTQRRAMARAWAKNRWREQVAA
ncbi:MAG: hypothetical protein IPK75_18125 [Acidobacteria bacterium]|nr:hypothetical protein [Acidobacteriota bacterium]